MFIIKKVIIVYRYTYCEAHFLNHLSNLGLQSTGAFPSCHRLKGGVHVSLSLTLKAIEIQFKIYTFKTPTYKG